MRLLDRLGPVRAIAALALIAAACGGGDPEPARGVKVRALTTDVGLGAEKLSFPGAPAFLPTQEEDDEIAPPPFKVFRTVPPAPSPIDQCPEADVLDVPKVPATTAAEGRPPEQNYKWPFYSEGKIKIGQALFPFKGTILIERAVSGVKETPEVGPGAFTYNIAGASVAGVFSQTFTYQVIPNAPTQAAPTDLGRGIYLTMIVTDYLEGGQLKRDTFMPSPPVEYMRFPATNGQAIDSRGFDPNENFHPVTNPNAGQGLRNVTVARGTRQYDACGERIDAWYYEGSQEVSSPDPSNSPLPRGCTRTGGVTTCEYEYNYAFATQYGGLIAHEFIERPKAPAPPTPAPSIVAPTLSPSPKPTPKLPETPKPTPRATPSPPPTPKATHPSDEVYVIVDMHIGQIPGAK